MDPGIFMVVLIFAFCVHPYCKVVAETVEVKVYSNASNVIVNILTSENNRNLTPNPGLKTLQSEFNPNVSKENPMIILVPQKTVFREFLFWNEDNTEVSGFCIEVFKAALQDLGPDAFPYKFVPFNGSYNDLIKEIHDNKTIGGAVGDITMLASRSKLVDFTAPYMESGIAMVTRAKDETGSVWMVFRPFSKEIWLAMIGTFLYTGLVVWFLEHGENPDFRGPWPKQFGNTVWFIFSTLFFAHRERITSNYSRIVIMVWLFLILVMVSCFTASLSSMLTVRKLTPEVNDVDYLHRHNEKVGCDKDSFIYNLYLKGRLNFKEENILKLNNDTEFDKKLNEKSIKAAFTEIPYLKVFLEKHPDKFKMADRIDQVGGLAFAFRKGSPYTSSISTAILNLTQKNKIADLENSLLYNKSENWNRSTKDRQNGLTIDNFWVLFVFSAGTSTVILIIFIIHLVQRFRRHQSDNSSGISRERVDSFHDKLLSFVKYWNEGKIVFPDPENRSQNDDGVVIVVNSIPKHFE